MTVPEISKRATELEQSTYIRPHHSVASLWQCRQETGEVAKEKENLKFKASRHMSRLKKALVKSLMKSISILKEMSLISTVPSHQHLTTYYTKFHVNTALTDFKKRNIHNATLNSHHHKQRSRVRKCGFKSRLSSAAVFCGSSTLLTSAKRSHRVASIPWRPNSTVGLF